MTDTDADRGVPTGPEGAPDTLLRSQYDKFQRLLTPAPAEQEFPEVAQALGSDDARAATLRNLLAHYSPSMIVEDEREDDR